MAKITFTDGTGAATLKSWYPVPADRFANWIPTTRPIGESSVVQATGATAMFKFRTDYGASFEIRGLRAHAINGVADIDIAERLIAWLLEGGTCSVQTEDVDANIYATCGLAPNTTPALALSDPRQLEYTLSLAVIDLSATPAAMVCRYDGDEVTS